MTRLLLVDDEPSILDTLRFRLEREGFEVATAGSGLEALQVFRQFQPHVVVLDVMLPDIDGLEVCRRLREQSAVPVLMLTARGEEMDRVLGLEVGADDYLVKPFSYRELLARIRALLRRLELDRQQVATPRVIQVGKVRLDSAARRVWKGDQEIMLSSREFDLLYQLMASAGQAVRRQELFDRVWGVDWIGDPHTLDVHIRWLRLKIEEDPANPKYIQTVRGYGYRFAGPEEV